MADLDRNINANPVRIIGDDGTGGETGPVETVDGKLKTQTTLGASSDVVGDVGIYDTVHGKPTGFTAFGLLKTAQETVIFDFRPNAFSLPRLMNINAVNQGFVSIESGDTGARLTVENAGSEIDIESKDAYEYQSGRGYMIKMSIITFDTGVAGNLREWGGRNYHNGNECGSYIRLDGTQLSWVIVRDGIETVINSEDWDVPVSVAAGNFNGNGHIWYIQMEFLLVGDFYLYYDEMLVHTYKFTGTSTQFNVSNPDMQLFYCNENSTNASKVELKFGCASIVSEGTPNAVRLNQSPEKNYLAALNMSAITAPDESTGEYETINAKQGALNTLTKFVTRDLDIMREISYTLKEIKKVLDVQTIHLEDLTDIEYDETDIRDDDQEL